MMVPQGQFQGKVDYITVTAERQFKDKFVQKYGSNEVKLNTDKTREDHMQNFLRAASARARKMCWMRRLHIVR
ncbi:MAG: hypothetical protein U0Y68_12700 [Blastocatellia bacterium]